ncbi:MAG: helix-turn-helix domain-containing protein [Kiritimatiellae bacterium]|jgi:Zn-dependent peptidase ImmA (M78 family)/transcriptional regulator with XRE-family HTH domain|nr:helix-turn-helix domain-containing protein [Kiritimatiellia bacterium]
MSITLRLRNFRDQAGLSQDDLGRQVGVTRQTIALWEKGERSPSLAQLHKVAKALEVPAGMLLDQGGRVDKSTILFRSDAPEALKPEVRDVLAKRSRDYSFIEKALGEVSALPPAHPFEGFDPALAENMASEVRDWLGVERGTLGDVFDLLEGRGLKVVLHPLPNEVSGLSAYTDESGAIFFVNSEHPVERQYFTALHELGHLIFHRGDYGDKGHKQSKKKEKMADYFAGALLLSRYAVEKELKAFSGQWIPEPLLADIKLRYQVSMRTVVIRAGQVGVITNKQSWQQYRWIENKYGPTSETPLLEKSKTLRRLDRLVFRALLAEEITTSKAAEVLGRNLVSVHKELSAWLGDAES